MLANPELLKPLFCHTKGTALTSEVIIDSLSFDDCKSFASTQAKDWFVTYINETDKLSQFLSFSTGFSIIPYGGLQGNIYVKYLADDDENSLMKASACLKIVFIPTVYSTKEKFFESIDVALDHGSIGFPNP